MRRVWEVKAFGTSWISFSLMSALVLVSSLQLDYGQSARITLNSYIQYRVIDPDSVTLRTLWSAK